MTVAVVERPTAPLPAPRRTPLRRMRHQVRYDLLVMTRNREARFFTFALPVLMLLLFVAIFGNQTFELGGRTFPGSTYYVANQLVFGIVDAAMMTTAVAIVGYRELGILKRRRATPQPAWVLIVSRAILAVCTSLVLASVLLGLGRAVFGIAVPLRAMPALLLSLALGSFAFCALGFATSSLIRTNESAMPTVMGLTLPLFFISGVFVPWFLIPPWLRAVAQAFPVRHLAAATTAALTSSHGAALRPADLAIVTLWGVAALAVAARRFSWSPRAA